MIRKGIYALILVVSIIFLGKGFLLQSDTVYGFHDITQFARVSDFSVNLAHGMIPPRIAPNFSHQRGYPIFNHYAPLAYYITSGLHFAGMDIPYAVKLSFFLAFLTAGIGMWAWMKEHVSEAGALVSGVLYATSAYIGTEIFVRGNLAEVWFIALFPCVLWSIDKYVRVQSYNALVGVIVYCGLLLLAHNVLSLVGFAFVFLYAVTYRSSLLVVGVLTAIPLVGAFIFPAFFELSQTHASQIATQTNYAEHFLCLSQLWNSPIGYAGSVAGCADGMSFQLGKVLLVLGFIGGMLWLIQSIRARKVDTRLVQQAGIVMIGIASLYVSSSYASGIWESISGLHVFQFPWRLLVFVLFAGAYFGGYAVAHIPNKYIAYTCGALAICASIYLAGPFFKPNPDAQWSSKVFTDTYLSQEYIQNSVAYQVPEYIPTSVQLDAWMKLKVSPQGLAQDKIMPLDDGTVIPLNLDPFEYAGATSSKNFYLDIHMAPYWTVLIDNKVKTPYRIDELGRPHYTSENEKILVDIIYIQTPLEKMSNAISVMTGVLLVGICLKKWKPMS